MESDLKLKITRKKDGVPLIELTFSQKRYKRILEHVSSLSEEEREESLRLLEEQILRRKK